MNAEWARGIFIFTNLDGATLAYFLNFSIFWRPVPFLALGCDPGVSILLKWR